MLRPILTVNTVHESSFYDQIYETRKKLTPYSNVKFQVSLRAVDTQRAHGFIQHRCNVIMTLYHVNPTLYKRHVPVMYILQ